MNQTRIIIRPLRLTDAHDIHELMHMPNVLWGTSLLPSTTTDTWHKIIESWVQDERMHVFVAEIQGKVAGIINLHVGTGRERTSVHFAFTKTSTLKLRVANALTLFAGAVILIVIYWHVYVRVLANKVTGLPGRRHIRRSKTVMPKH